MKELLAAFVWAELQGTDGLPHWNTGNMNGPSHRTGRRALLYLYLSRQIKRIQPGPSPWDILFLMLAMGN